MAMEKNAATDIYTADLNRRMECMAVALAADVDYYHVDYAWAPDRDRYELQVLVCGDYHGVWMRYTVAPYTGEQPPADPGDHTDEPAPAMTSAMVWEVHAEWEGPDAGGRSRVSLCTDDMTVISLLRGARAEWNRDPQI
jgi:hypothetical protein